MSVSGVTGWQTTQPCPLLRKTVYWMDAFNVIIGNGTWDLGLPLTVRDVLIDATVLSGVERVSAHLVEERTLMLTTPLLQGSDVLALQQALIAKGIAVQADGIFSPATDKAVIRFQRDAHLEADGIIGRASRSALGL